MHKFVGVMIGLLLVVAAVGIVLVSYFRLEGEAPELEVAALPEALGREFVLEVAADDGRSGLSLLNAVLIQGEKIAVLGSKMFPAGEWWRGSGIRAQRVSWSVRPLELGLVEGRAVLRITARDSSWRDGFQGNERKWEAEVILDMTPPRIAVRSTVHNLRSGGAGLVSYRVSERPSRTGVWIDEIFFPGYPKPGGEEGLYIALIAVPFDVQEPRRLVIEALDAAGNSAVAGFPSRVTYQKPKKDRITITDGFLEAKMPDFMVRNPNLSGSLVEVFLKINSELRRSNNVEIAARCGVCTPEILWEGSFVSLPRAAVRAGFADHRYYYYHGKEIDQRYHLGVDLASVSHAPVPAGNNGVVVFAEYLGIYGHTVILDHGLGLCSMYSHLSEIHVAPGQRVARGDIIGATGMTGLAGGDHLHYAMTVNGVFVTPLEWWDQKWINDHILANLGAE